MPQSDKKVCKRAFPPEKMTPSMLLKDVSRLVENKMRRECDAFGMRQGYRRIMFQLSHGDDGAKQQELVQHTKLSAPTISVALARMEEENLIRRQSDLHDMRVTRVFLTEHGKTVNEKMQHLLHEVEDDLTGSITAEEQAQLKAILLKIRNGLLEKGAALDEKM